MIPLTSEVKELKYVKKVVVYIVDAEIRAVGADLHYDVGTIMMLVRSLTITMIK